MRAGHLVPATRTRQQRVLQLEPVANIGFHESRLRRGDLGERAAKRLHWPPTRPATKRPAGAARRRATNSLGPALATSCKCSAGARAGRAILQQMGGH